MKPRDRIRRTLESTDEVLFAYLFGSRADEKARSDSDWDIAVYLDESLSAQQRFRVRLGLTADLDALERVDLAVLNDAPPLLAHRALLGKRLLVRDEKALVRFTVRTLSLAEDDRHFSEIHQRARMKRLAEGRFGRPHRL